MNSRIRNVGGIGLAMAIMAALSTTACDPYLAANTSQPVVLGVLMVDTNYNGLYSIPDSAGCTVPYPQVDQTWAATAFPGLCDPANIDKGLPSLCPVQCYPPRMGPGFAPLFMGNIGGSYQTIPAGTYTYTLPAIYALSNVPPTYIAADGSEFVYAQIRIQFNKLMDPQTIQPDPLLPVPPSTLRVLRGTVDATADFAVEYNPDSEAEYWGASIMVTPLSGVLDPNTAYTITGTVADQQGNPLTVLVVVTTGVAIDETPLPAFRGN